MKIKNKLYIGMFIPVAFTCTLLFFEYKFDNTLEKMIKETTNTNKIIKHIIQLNILTHDVLINNTNRSKSQWKKNKNKLKQLLSLSKNTLWEKPQISLMKIMKNKVRELEILLKKLQNISHKKNSEALSQFFYNQMHIKINVMVSTAYRLHKKSRARLKAHKQYRIVIIIFAIILVFLIIGINIFIYKSILPPIHTLNLAMNKIGSGERSFQADITADNEIGDLAKNFNTMIQKLYAITTSRNELREEVITRKKIQANLEKKTKELKESNEKLRDLNKELDEFSYMASHDLQEPLRKIVSFSQLLEKDIGQELNKNAKVDLELIIDGAKRMKTLIQDILLLSRSGRQKLNFSEISLEEIIDNILFIFSEQIKEKKATIIRDSLPKIYGDHSMIEQLYQNIISNALKFNNRDPIEIHIGCEDTGKELVFFVKDNGIGISPEYAEQIFKPFKRLHTRKNFQGTGIGLAICQKVIKKHNGKIWVESEQGKGCCFKFIFPQKI